MENVGRIIGISDLNVKVILLENNIKIGDILICETNEKKHRFEVVEIDSNIATTIPFESVVGLKKGLQLDTIEEGLSIEYSDEILGKVFNSYGDLIDNSVIKKPKTKKAAKVKQKSGGKKK